MEQSMPTYIPRQNLEQAQIDFPLDSITTERYKKAYKKIRKALINLLSVICIVLNASFLVFTLIAVNVLTKYIEGANCIYLGGNIEKCYPDTSSGLILLSFLGYAILSSVNAYTGFFVIKTILKLRGKKYDI